MAARRRETAGASTGPGTTGSENKTQAPTGTTGQQGRMRKKGKWWQCGPIKFFLLLFSAIFVLNFASLKREHTYLMPPGELKDIGWGQKLFIRCTGKGEPVIVLDSPTGETSDMWVGLEPVLSKHNKVCVYDRAGLGFSERAYKNTSAYSSDYSEAARLRDLLIPGTVERMADDLHRLLRETIGDTSVVLVGTDFSALISRFYAQLYGEKVKGLFLIDPMVETLFDNNSPWLQHWYEEAVPHINMLYLGGTIGINRVALMVGAMKPVQNLNVMKKLPQELINRKKYLLCSSTHLSSVLDEVFLANDSLKQVKTLFKVKPFPRHIPITIATYTKSKEMKEVNDTLTAVWDESQEILTTLIHPSAQRVSLPGHDHNMFILNPKPVVNAINSFLKQLKQTAGI